MIQRQQVVHFEFEFQYNVSSEGSDYNNVNVTVHDIAGNTATVPFSVILDNTGPTTVSTLSSTSHSPSVSSSDNDIDFTWSDVTDSESGIIRICFYSGYMRQRQLFLHIKFLEQELKRLRKVIWQMDHHTMHNIRPVDNVGNWGTTAHDGPYIIGRGSLAAIITSSDNIISTDQQFTITMNVDNTGSAQVDSVDPSALTVAATGSAGATTSSNPAAQNIDNGSNRNFLWTYTAGSSPGVINFTGNASGTDAEGVITSNTAVSADVYVEQKANLTVSTVAVQSSVNVGQTITIEATYSNTGEADAVTVTPILTPSGTANPTIDSGPVPTSFTIKGGQSKKFTFKAHGTLTGTATFTADISAGTDEHSGNNLSVSTDADNVTVQSAASSELTSSIVATPTALEETGTITVTMDVQNTGNTTVNSISPSTLTIGGTSTDASIATGPTPASVSSLTASSTQQFVWTYTAGSTLGTVNFSGNATGTEASSSSTTSSDVTIQAGSAVLTSSIVATPTSLLTNATIAVTMTVNNTAATGSASANSVAPSTLTLGGTSGEANLLTGPVPTSANIAPQGSQDFVWTYKAGLTAGTVNFTGNATGSDSNSSADVSSTSNASGNVTIATLSPSWTYPTGTDTVGPIRSVPIAYNVITDYIYFGSDDNKLYILDGTTHGLVSSFTASGDIRGLPFPSTGNKRS